MKQIELLQNKINATKAKMTKIKEMRPGSITEQMYRKGDKQWPYWQISYTLNKKSKTEYLRDEFVVQVKKEVAEYKKFRTLVDTLVELNIALSKSKIEILKKSHK